MKNTTDKLITKVKLNDRYYQITLNKFGQFQVVRLGVIWRFADTLEEALQKAEEESKRVR